MRLDDIEKGYRLGTLTNGGIGKRNGVSEAYVRKVAKKYGWVFCDFMASTSAIFNLES